MHEAMRQGHGHRHPHDGRGPGALRESKAQAGEATSVLRQSAVQRLVIVALPILALWLAVAFALDLLA